jgi:non-reducing end alpha-L-arabinofuranosidase
MTRSKSGGPRAALTALALLCVPVSLGGLTSSCWDYRASGSIGGLTGSAGATSSGGSTSGGSGGSTSAGSGGSTSGADSLPCEVFENAGHPCVAAHSTVRVLVRGYSGSLYQVERPDRATQDIGSVDGYADAAAQDAFCSGGGCTIKIIYDQSPKGNHLTIAPPGSAKPTWAKPAPADRHRIQVNGRMLYGILFRPGEGYRSSCNECEYPDPFPSGTAVGDEAQTMYMVSSQHDLVNGCCFDYGNAEVTANNDGNGTMEAVYLGQGVIWGTGVQGGPWVMADLENGLFAGWERGQDRNISTNTPLKHDFVTAVVVGDTADKNDGKGRFALYGADATSGPLTTMYDGIRPEKPGYVPMKKQGSVILSIGGDNSDFDGGRFYEGVMASGAATKQTLDALQASIVAAGYGK